MANDCDATECVGTGIKGNRTRRDSGDGGLSTTGGSVGAVCPTANGTTSSEPFTYSVADLVRMLGLCDRTVRQRIKDGVIPHYRVGRRILCDRSTFHEWMANRMQGGEGAP
jgi:excisionase family DNA binding protein